MLFLLGWLGLATSSLAEPAPEAVDLPPPLDINGALFDRYWTWLKAEAGASQSLRPPPIEIAPLPANVRMGFFYPTDARPHETERIVMSPLSIDRAAADQRLVVLAELAHEMVHYVLVMRENGWPEGDVIYTEAQHHHCDAEFQRLNRGIADILWQAYHSADTTRAIDRMVRLACWRDGHSLGATAVARD